MSDRRRVNGPAGNTQQIVFPDKHKFLSKPERTRKPNELRKIFLQTGLIPHASGSAYLELEPSATAHNRSFIPTTSTIKLSCAVQGPKPLPRNAHFSPNLQVNASVKLAPFATRQRRGYLRDNIERDLGAHLENALNGVLILDRWPKSSLDVAVTVLEGEEDCLWNEERGQEKGISGVGLMNVLAASINVAVAALVDANIDCLDVLVGGVAANVTETKSEILDPCPSEHEEIHAATVVGYLPNRDEVVEIWNKSSSSSFDEVYQAFENLTDAAVKAAKGVHKVLAEVMLENVQRQHPQHEQRKQQYSAAQADDVNMQT